MLKRLLSDAHPLLPQQLYHVDNTGDAPTELPLLDGALIEWAVLHGRIIELALLDGVTIGPMALFDGYLFLSPAMIGTPYLIKGLDYRGLTHFISLHWLTTSLPHII